jgi:hypothetical protein
MIQIERYLTLIIMSEMRAFSKSWDFDVLRQAGIKNMSKLELSEEISKLVFSARFEEHQNLNFLKKLSFQAW